MPNEPPTSLVTTRIWCSCRSRCLANRFCIMCGACVPWYTVMRCSPVFQSATMERGLVADAGVAAEHEGGLDHLVGFGEALVGIARDMHALEGEVVAELGMDHRRLRIERGLRIGDGRELFVVDLDQLAAVLGLGAGARHHGADRFAGPAGAVDRDGVLRRGLDALEMRQHADPGRDDLRKLRAGDDGDHAGRLLRRIRVDAFDLRVRVRRAHERHMRHARQHHVADILRAALHQPRHIGPRHRAADIGVRPVERGEDGRGVVDDFHVCPPARCFATASMASTMA